MKNRQFFYLQHEELARAMGIDGDVLPVILDALGASHGLLACACACVSVAYDLTSDSTRCREPADDDAQTVEPSLDHPVRKKLQNYMEFYMTPSKHAAYAATWYSFSVAAAVLAYVRFKKGRVAAIKPKKA